MDELAVRDCRRGLLIVCFNDNRRVFEKIVNTICDEEVESVLERAAG